MRRIVKILGVSSLIAVLGIPTITVSLLGSSAEAKMVDVGINGNTPRAEILTSSSGSGTNADNNKSTAASVPVSIGALSGKSRVIINGSIDKIESATMFSIHDDTGSVTVATPKGGDTTNLKVGDRVMVDGTVDSGLLSTKVVAMSVTIMPSTGSTGQTGGSTGSTSRSSGY